MVNNGWTTLSIKEKTLQRVNAFLPKSIKPDDFLNYILNRLQSDQVITLSDLINTLEISDSVFLQKFRTEL